MYAYNVDLDDGTSGDVNCKSPNKWKVGDEVEVGINLRGREWTSPQGEVKYFNTIQGWKIGDTLGS
jgi:hypothetical protein